MQRNSQAWQGAGARAFMREMLLLQRKVRDLLVSLSLASG